MTHSQQPSVKDFEVAVDIAPLATAVSATATRYATLRLPARTVDLASKGTVYAIVDEIGYTILLAGAADATNKWSITLAGQDKTDLAYDNAILAAEDLIATAVAYKDGNTSGSTSAWDITGLEAPGLLLTLTKAASAPNITAGQVVIRGHIICVES